jgi:hypothetical protein
MGHQIKATTVTNVRNGTIKYGQLSKNSTNTKTSRDSGSGTKMGYRRLPMQQMSCAIKAHSKLYLLFLLFSFNSHYLIVSFVSIVAFVSYQFVLIK